MYINCNSGFTLIETLVSTVLIAVVISAVFGLYQFGLVNWKSIDEESGVQDSMRVGLDRMSREVRQAKVIHADSSANELIFYDSEYKKIIYTNENNTLYRKKGSSTKQPVVDYIEDINFEYGPKKTVTLRVVGKTGDMKEIFHTTVIGMRVGLAGE